MGILGQVLPGLRDLRAPISAGFVWVAIAAWLLADRLTGTTALPTRELQSRYDWILTWPLPARFGALTFVAYVVGMLSVSLTRSLRLRARTVRARPVRRRARQLATAVANELSDRFTTDREFRDAVGRNLSPAAMSEAMQDLYVEGTTTAPPLAYVGGRLWHFPEDLVALLELAPDERDRLADWFVATSLTNTRLRTAVLSFTVNQPAYVAKLAEELETYPEQLIVPAPAVFDRWDRVHAESEFREALVLPGLGVSLIVGTLLFPATDVLRHPVQALLATLLAALVPTVLLWLGLQKEHEAEAQLLAAWKARVVPSPVLESLRGNELLWRATSDARDRGDDPGRR